MSKFFSCTFAGFDCDVMILPLYTVCMFSFSFSSSLFGAYIGAVCICFILCAYVCVCMIVCLCVTFYGPD